MGLVMDLADRVHGPRLRPAHRLRTPAEVQADPDVIRAYLGRRTQVDDDTASRGRHCGTTTRRHPAARDRAARAPRAWPCGRRTSASGRRSPGLSTGTASRTSPTGCLALGVEPGDRVAVHAENRPEWLSADVGGGGRPRGDRRPLPHQPAGRGALPAVRLRRQGAHRRGPGAGRQGARGAGRAAPTCERIVYIEPRGVRALRRRPAHVVDGLRGSRPPRTATSTPTRSTGSMAQAATPTTWPRSSTRRARPGPPRARCSRWATWSSPSRRWWSGGGFCSPPPRPADMLLSYLPLCHVAERIFTVWFNARVGVRGQLRRVDRDRHRRTCARCSRRSSSACPASGRSWPPASPSGPPRPAGSSAANFRFWTGVAQKIGRRPGAHRRPPHPGQPAALRRRLGVPVPRAARTASACASAATPPRGRRPSRPSSPVLHGRSACPCTRSTG